MPTGIDIYQTTHPQNQNMQSNIVLSNRMQQDQVVTFTNTDQETVMHTPHMCTHGEQPHTHSEPNKLNTTHPRANIAAHIANPTNLTLPTLERTAMNGTK